MSDLIDLLMRSQGRPGAADNVLACGVVPLHSLSIQCREAWVPHTRGEGGCPLHGAVVETHQQPLVQGTPPQDVE